ncbi:ribosome biogenesis protein [Niveomyces insectorum RCEF 264]|uniref:Pescadillo homolog n=1 Tax=Niveomyces insectorum RCEF 264 TaxID=1081102 RepID=A0A167NA29_9HYPO|nr:ribosome biogenesis protein [Niveomyces insectorum RCEF 264]
MARPKKKGEAGAAKNYITRTQAVRKLQLSLPDFRKLCIWKGIYPREPRSRKKASRSSTASTTFYYAKDIQFLLHEPLVQKFREQKVLEKKIARALGRGDVTDAQRFERAAARPTATGRPRYTLDHVVRERYPTFVDALRDLDDGLSMLFLFANLPATAAVPAKMVARCERLCLEFQHYLIVSHSLRKSFLSIKGIYYQATIQGEDVLWLVPYKFNQRVVGDIDFRILGTFVEFYLTLLGFVNFRLYTSVGLKYPPRFDAAKDDGAAELAAFTLEGAAAATPQGTAAELEAAQQKQLADGHGPDPALQAEVNKLVKELKQEEVGAEAVVPNASEAAVDANDEDQQQQEQEQQAAAADNDAIDKFEPAGPGGDILPQPSYSTSNPQALFAKCTVYLSRETPRAALEFILRAFGCKRIGWDAVLGEGAYTTNELDPAITHQIVDRPPVQVKVDADGDEGGNDAAALKVAANRRMVPGRIYVQPQWVWDSINAEELQRPDLYAPGAQLPPHLSPFVKSVQGQYDPSLPLEQQQTEAEALASDDDDDEDEEDEEEEEEEETTAETANGKVNGKAALAAKAKIAKKTVSSEDEDEDSEDENGGMDVAGSEDDEDDDVDADVTFSGLSDKADEAPETDNDDDNEEDDEETVSAARQRQRELEAELTGQPVRHTPVDPRAKAKADARKALAKAAKREAEELERAKGLLPKKKRRLYEQMVYTNTKRSAEDEKLRAKRRKIERKAKGKAGKA